MSQDRVIEEAKKLRNNLLEFAEDHKIQKQMAEVNIRPCIGNPELMQMDIETCENSAAMLQKLGTEVYRLRESIGHYRYGWMSRTDLIRIPETWNCDPIRKGEERQ